MYGIELMDLCNGVEAPEWGEARQKYYFFLLHRDLGAFRCPLPPLLSPARPFRLTDHREQPLPGDAFVGNGNGGSAWAFSPFSFAARVVGKRG